MTTKISKLNKMLYMAAKSNTSPAFQNDPEAIKTLRDNACEEMFGKHYSDLTDTQLKQVITALNASSERNDNNLKLTYATKPQLDSIKFYGMQVAIEYMDFGEKQLRIIVKSTGEIIEGEHLREFLRSKFPSQNQHIPKNIFVRIMKDYLNPLLNKWLLEGDFKKRILNYNSMYLNNLTPTQADYLIKRLMQMSANLKVSPDRENYMLNLN